MCCRRHTGCRLGCCRAGCLGGGEVGVIEGTRENRDRVVVEPCQSSLPFRNGRAVQSVGNWITALLPLPSFPRNA